MLHSRKDKDSKNLNRIVVQLGDRQTNRDILDFIVYDGKNEYTLNDLFQKILFLEDENKKLRKAIKTYETANNDTTTLLTKAVELLSAKVASAEDEISTLKDKTKYL